jgi:hypothetical protein
MKYIMFKVDLGEGVTQKIPVIFPDELVHLIVSRALAFYKATSHLVPVSAGYCQIDCHSVSGASETLKLLSEDGDAEVINMHNIKHGLSE